MRIILKRVFVLASCGFCLIFAGCGANDTSQISGAATSPTPTASPSPEIIIGSPYTPSAEERSFYEAEASAKAPSISSEDYSRGVAEGNIYVVYSNVMCFGATLDTPEDYKQSQHTAQEIADYEAMYAAIPQEVLDQSQLNKRGGFTVSQGCYDAGWTNPGAV